MRVTITIDVPAAGFDYRPEPDLIEICETLSYRLRGERVRDMVLFDSDGQPIGSLVVEDDDAATTD